ncbi:hypothetical protein [Streptomyces sp. NPDC102437]|uniref:hypothetical protein n=1 Tax=Streptomyces sp. NPDC102437 TaxID=3366175 RepID=UPI00380909F5
MTSDSTTVPRTATTGSTSGYKSISTPGYQPGSTVVVGAAGVRDAQVRGGFASDSVPRHLARGAVGFGALVGSLALLPVVGPGSLVLAPVGLVALRGCPMCWAIGLVETVSAGRLRRSCVDGRCELTHAKSRGPAPKRSRVADHGG